MQKKTRGRPKIMKKSVRVIIQLESTEYAKIKKAIKEEKSVAQFFRESANLMLDQRYGIL